MEDKITIGIIEVKTRQSGRLDKFYSYLESALRDPKMNCQFVSCTESFARHVKEWILESEFDCIIKECWSDDDLSRNHMGGVYDEIADRWIPQSKKPNKFTGLLLTKTKAN